MAGFYYNTTVTPTSTGVKTITCGFPPVAMKITLSAKSVGGDSYLHQSVGQCDNSGYSTCASLFQDATGSQTYKSVTKMVSHYERVSGTITEVNSATFSAFTATEGKFNVTLVSSAYQYNIELWG